MSMNVKQNGKDYFPMHCIRQNKRDGCVPLVWNMVQGNREYWRTVAVKEWEHPKRTFETHFNGKKTAW